MLTLACIYTLCTLFFLPSSYCSHDSSSHLPPGYSTSFQSLAAVPTVLEAGSSVNADEPCENDLAQVEDVLFRLKQQSQSDTPILDRNQSIGCVNAQPGKKIYAYIQEQKDCKTLLAELKQLRNQKYLPYTDKEIEHCFNKKHLYLIKITLEQALIAARI